MPPETWTVFVDRRVEKDLADAPDHLQVAFADALDELAGDPRRPRPGFDVKALAGHRGVWRLRLGHWRVLYAVDGRRRTVHVTTVARRGTVDR